MIKTLIHLPRPLLTRLKAQAKVITAQEGRYISVSELIRRAISDSLGARQSLDEEENKNGSNDND